MGRSDDEARICADHLSGCLYVLSSRFVWPVGAAGFAAGFAAAGTPAPDRGSNQHGHILGGFHSISFVIHIAF